MRTKKFASDILAVLFGCCLSASVATNARAGGDIFDGYIQIGGTWYNIGGVNDGRNNPNGSANAAVRTVLSAASFGTQTYGSFSITGFQINGWTSSGTSVANNGANYKVWRSGDNEPSYSNFWNNGFTSYYSGGDYYSQATAQNTGIIGDTFVNGDTYNLKIQTFTDLSGDNAGSKYYENSTTFVVNGARQLITGAGNTTQSAVYNTSANGGVVKQGTGSLTLVKDNSNGTTGQKGLIYIDEGTVAVNPEIGVSGNSVLGGSGAEIRLGGTTGTGAAKFVLADTDGGLSISRNATVRNGSSGTKTIGSENTSGVNTNSGNVYLDDNVTFSASSGGTFVLSGRILDGDGAGTYGAAINAGGTVQLAGSSANSGTIWTVQEGTLELNKSAGTDAINGTTVVEAGGTLKNLASNQINDSTSVTIQSSGSWDLNGQSETVNSLANSGSLSLGAGQIVMADSGGTWSGSISAASGGSLTFNGGTTGLSAANTGMLSGSEIYLNAGTLGLNNNNAAGSATVYLGNATGSANAVLDSSSSGTSIGNKIVVRSGSSGTNTIDNASGGTVTFGGNVGLQTSLYVDASDGETTVFNGVISNISGTDGIVKRGFGTMTIGGASTFGGVMAIDEGSLRIASGGDLTAASNITIGSSIYNSGAGAADLTLASGALGIDRSIVVASGAGSRFLASEGNNTVSGTITQSANLTVSNTTGTLNLSAVTMNTSGNNDLNVNGAGNVTIGGTISAGSGASEIFKNDGGTLTISGDNSSSLYKLHLNAGTTILGSANSLGTAYSDKVNFDGTSTLRVSANIAPASLGLRVGNGITGTVQVDSGNNFSVATLGSSGGTGTFNKTGTGTLTLTGTSTVANANNVSAGTLFVSSGAELAGTTTVSSGGTLAGSGSVGATTIGSGGTISPGNSPGTLSLTNGLTFSAGGDYNWQIFNATGTAGASNGWDLIAVSGGAWNINGLTTGSFDINLWSLSGISPDVNGNATNFNSASSYTWEILTYTSLVGTFDASLFNINVAANNGTTGFANSLGGGVFSLAVDGDSLNLLFTPGGGPGPSPVPEPGTWAAATMLAGAAGYMRWRRRKEQANS